MNIFLSGVIFAMALMAAGLFLDFWKKTRDQLFLFFALAFGLLGAERLVLAFLPQTGEYKVYLIRLLAFILIIVAIILKNRPRKN